MPQFAFCWIFLDSFEITSRTPPHEKISIPPLQKQFKTLPEKSQSPWKILTPFPLLQNLKSLKQPQTIELNLNPSKEIPNSREKMSTPIHPKKVLTSLKIFQSPWNFSIPLKSFSPPPPKIFQPYRKNLNPSRKNLNPSRKNSIPFEKSQDFSKKSQSLPKKISILLEKFQTPPEKVSTPPRKSLKPPPPKNFSTPPPR